MNWLREIAGTDLMAHAVIAAVIVVAFFFLSRVVKSFLGFLGRRLLTKSQAELDGRILSVILSRVRPLIVVIGFEIGLREVGKGVSETELTARQMLEYGGAILYILILIIIVRILLGILKEIVHWYFEKKSEGDHAGLRLTLAPVTNKAVSILVCMVAIIILLDHFGINIGSLLVSLGVGSLAVALAAQDTLANMIAGFVILIDRPFRVGDRVQLASGEIGDVQLIGLRSTRILNFDANVIVVPNAELVKGRITNYSHPSSHVRVVLRVSVAYGSDPAGIRRIMLDAAYHHSEVLKDPEPSVLFTDLGESAMEFTLITRVADYTREGVVRSELREKIYLAFQSAGIEIPFPDRSFSRKQMHDGTQTPES